MAWQSVQCSHISKGDPCHTWLLIKLITPNHPLVLPVSVRSSFSLWCPVTSLLVGVEDVVEFFLDIRLTLLRCYHPDNLSTLFYTLKALSSWSVLSVHHQFNVRFVNKRWTPQASQAPLGKPSSLWFTLFFIFIIFDGSKYNGMSKNTAKKVISKHRF